MRTPRRIALAAGIVLGLVALAEVAARALGADEPRPAFESLARERAAAAPGFRYDPRRFYTVEPHHRLGPHHAGRFATGAWPFRGRPAEPAPPWLLRVAVVGDSSVYGTGVPVAHGLVQRVQEHLAEAGLGPCRVQVLNFGVQGYTTVQVRLLVEEVLERHEPDAVVVSAAGWNDQGPSPGVDDVELLEGPPPAPWARALPGIAGLVARVRGSDEVVLSEVSPEELKDAWERGEPLFGTKVPAEEVPRQVRRMLEACEAEGVEAVVVVPAHPAETLRDYPRTAADREAVRRAATGAGVGVVDGPALYAASGLPPERFFLDFAHPTPEGHDVLAEAVAERLLERLPPPRARPAGAPAVRVADVAPRLAPVLGDVPVRVRLEGAPAAEETPVVLVGGAPLLDVRVLDDGELEGVLVANAPGAHDVVVQAAGWCAVQEDGIVLEAPRLELVEEPPLRVAVLSRPGDRARVYYASERRDTPAWLDAGAGWLGVAAGPPLETPPCDGDGRAEVALPPAVLALDPLFLQAGVLPAGETTWGRAEVASEVLAVPR